MLGVKLNQRFGALYVFRAVALLFGAGQALMTFSPNATLMITAQGLCGAAGAALVPSLVALIAENYKGTQQATAVGALGSARAGAGVAAFLIGGVLGTFIGWRPAFAILIVLAAIVFILSFRLKPDKGRPGTHIGDAGADRRGGAHQHRVTATCSQDRPPDHGGLGDADHCQESLGVGISDPLRRREHAH